ncbi:major facilitator superfamily permease [Oscillochloris trichoides DG-6]|uniref:Major facilitator superfamily permease n=1 Tax=Oscillochloris trichoides DG-6 TaxID=765420 RepID=E1IF98_9CHLR|nr:MFS transporter [Oscillochloris trichoides]EFO80138.1 major facilitator superfamily permease [Oscillochloris trichoides DG-6]
MTVTDDRKEQISWYFYDWANSAFSTTVVTLFLGPYLEGVSKAAADSAGLIYPLGIPIAYGSFFPYIVSLSVLLQVLFLPILGAIADYSNIKKQLLGIFAYIGAFATMGLFFVQGSNYMLGGGLFLIANLAFGAAMVFYNAYLPEIASPDRRDAVSSQGWATGYLGGGLLLVLNLILFLNAKSFGLSEGLAVRICLASAGMWWAIFTIIPMLNLRVRAQRKALPAGQHYVTVGFKQLAHTFSQMRHYPQTLTFLAAYLLYNDGIQAVIALASVFGAAELGIPQTYLIATILMVQFVAFGGALAFGWLARRIGSKLAIMVSLVVWVGAVIFGYFIPANNVPLFFVLGAIIAVVLGGSQAISRSVFSLMIPAGQEAEYFSLYEVSERGTSWLAPLFFGLALQFTGSYRIAIVSLMVFFIAGLIILTRVDVRKAALEAGNTAPAHG